MDSDDKAFAIVVSVIFGSFFVSLIAMTVCEHFERRHLIERGYEEVYDDGCECKLWKPTKDTAND